MIEEHPNRQTAAPAADDDPYTDRRAELHQLMPLKRIVAIQTDLKMVARLPTTVATFHRKKLLRMLDAARLEAKLVTPIQLQRENSPFAQQDFSKASIVWQPRRIRA